MLAEPFEEEGVVGMKVVALDHFVLTVGSIERAVEFYERVLGMEHITFGPKNRSALRFGDQKINLHPARGSNSPPAGCKLIF